MGEFSTIDEEMYDGGQLDEWEARNDGRRWINGLCSYCHQPPTDDDHDPCIANLPCGVTHACCGHGVPEPDGSYKLLDDACYLSFDGDPVLYGSTARWAMRVLGGNPPDASEGSRVPREWCVVWARTAHGQQVLFK